MKQQYVVDVEVETTGTDDELEIKARRNEGAFDTCNGRSRLGKGLLRPSAGPHPSDSNTSQ
jgi:hypothetical protein